jgi:hypothetical protein
VAITTFARMQGFRSGLNEGMRILGELRLAAAEAVVIGKLGFDPVQITDQAVRCSGKGSQILTLPGPIPITAVSALVVDTVAWTVLNPGDAEAGQQAWLPDHGDWLEARDPYVFTEGRGNILVTRTAGYATMPADLQDVTAMYALVLLDESKNLGHEGAPLSKDASEKILRDWDHYQVFRDVVAKYGKKF